MSLLSDTIREVNLIRRKLDDQETFLTGILRSNRSQMALVREALAGSNSGHHEKMLSALQQAEDSPTKSLRQIQQPYSALTRIELI